MIVQQITQQLKEWKENRDLSTEEQAKATRLAAFQNLTGLQIYIRDDIENYQTIKDFVELLRVMGALCFPYLSVQNMEGTFVKEDPEIGWVDEWIFEFDVNGKEEEFSLPPSKNDDFFEDLLDKFNEIIKKNGLPSQFHRLNVIGDLLAKPALEIALLEPNVEAKMMGANN